MRKRLSMLRPVAVTAALLFAAVGARAQFAGDLFFVTPSIAVPQGGTGALELALFSGDRVFGATRAQVRFDPAKLQLLSVEPATNASLKTTIRWKVSGGLIELLALNAESLSAPIGSVKLARLQFRVLGGVGERTALTTSVSGAIDAQRATLRTGTGLGGEITVSATAERATPMAHQDAALIASDLERRALAVRPPGHAVTLQIVDAAGRTRQAMVQTAQPGAARD